MDVMDKKSERSIAFAFFMKVIVNKGDR